MAHRYGSEHKRLRRRYAREVEAGMAVCCRCLKPIHPQAQWHLDHAADGEGYLGPAHALCNLQAAGKVRAAQLYGSERGDSREAVRREGRASRDTLERMARLQPGDLEARTVWLEWGKRTGLAGNVWSRHWAGDGYDGRCPSCRRLGGPCEKAEA